MKSIRSVLAGALLLVLSAGLAHAACVTTTSPNTSGTTQNAILEQLTNICNGSAVDGSLIGPVSLTSTGTLFAVSDTTGYGSISVQVTSAGIGATITYQVSEDGITWTAVAGYGPASTGSTTPGSQSTSAQLLWFPVTAKQFRAQVTTYASGTVTAQATLRKEPLPRQAIQVGFASGLGINQVGGYDKFVTNTPTVQNAAYSSGNSIGGMQSISFFRGNGGSGILNNISIASKGGATTAITLYIFQSNPTGTTCTDKTAFAIGAADYAKIIPSGPIVVTPSAQIGITGTIGASQTPVSVQNQESSSTLYVCPVVGGSVTPASTTDLVFNYGGIQD